MTDFIPDATVAELAKHIDQLSTEIGRDFLVQGVPQQIATAALVVSLGCVLREMSEPRELDANIAAATKTIELIARGQNMN